MSAPGVVLVHDGYGVLPHVHDYADELAVAGIAVEVVDLYGGATAADLHGAEVLARALDRDAALHQVVEATRHVRAAGSRHVGLVGFSLGGTLALWAAAHGAVDAVVAYYATLGPDVAAAIRCPVQLHLAETDAVETPEHVGSFVAALQLTETPVDTFVYEGTQHSFANADVPAADPGAIEVARSRTIGFLHARLGG